MRRLWGLLRRPITTRRRPTALTPSLAPLEPRQLLAVGIIQAKVTPQVLKPTGAYVPITITGRAPAQFTGGVPIASFHVVDEYRRVEPAGRMRTTLGETLDVQKKYYYFNFAFKTYVKASRSTAVADGRHYYVTIAVGDAENGQSRTFAVIVPNGTRVRTRGHAPRR